MMAPRLDFIGTLLLLCLVTGVVLSPVDTAIGAGLGALVMIIRWIVTPADGGL